MVGLARRSLDGDVEARNQLLVELRPLVTRTVRLIVGAGAPHAEDAAQDALVDIAKGIGTLKEPQAVTAWSMRVATRRALKTTKRRRLIQRRLVYAEPPAAAESDGHLYDLKRAFDSLPPRMRAVAVLRLFAELSERETAAILGCSTGAVKSQLHLARRRLAAELSDRPRQKSVEKGGSDD